MRFWCTHIRTDTYELKYLWSKLGSTLLSNMPSVIVSGKSAFGDSTIIELDPNATAIIDTNSDELIPRGSWSINVPAETTDNKHADDAKPSTTSKQKKKKSKKKNNDNDSMSMKVPAANSSSNSKKSSKGKPKKAAASQSQHHSVIMTGWLTMEEIEKMALEIDPKTNQPRAITVGWLVLDR